MPKALTKKWTKERNGWKNPKDILKKIAVENNVKNYVKNTEGSTKDFSEEICEEILRFFGVIITKGFAEIILKELPKEI